ncbi:MAG: VOC family protein [Bacillota bacterium]
MTHPIRPYIPTVFFPVSNLKRSIEWYCSLLDMPLKPKHDGGGIYYFGMQGTDIILDSNMWGFPPMTMFDSSDIDASYEFCQKQQYSFLTELFRRPSVAHFSVASNMVCQAERVYVSDSPQQLLPRIARVIIHTGQADISTEWYETFLQSIREADPFVEGLDRIRMERGADLLFDDGTLSRTEPVNYDRLQLNLRVNPAILIESPDVEAAFDYVRSKGATITNSIETRNGIECFQFADPDGNGIMVGQKRT